MFCQRCHKRVNQCQCTYGPKLKKEQATQYNAQQLQRQLLLQQQAELQRQVSRPAKRYRCKKCGHQVVTDKKPENLKCPKCKKRVMESWDEALGALQKKVEQRKQTEVALKLQHAFRMKRATNVTLLRERDVQQQPNQLPSFMPVTKQRQLQLRQKNDHYLSDLFGLRLISDMTGHEHESELLIGHEYNTSYLRDAYDKQWGSLTGRAKLLLLQVLAKLRNANRLVNLKPLDTMTAQYDVQTQENWWLVNTTQALHRLACLTQGKTPILLAQPRIVGGQPGLYPLAYKLNPQNQKAGQEFVEYLKYIGATPSVYQMFKFLNATTGLRKVKPELSRDEKVNNHTLLSTIINGQDFQKLKQLGSSELAMSTAFEAVVKLVGGISGFSGLHRFKKGILVQSGLENLHNVIKLLVFHSKSVNRSRRLYDLALDEIFLICAATRPYKADALTTHEAEIQDDRIPTLKELLRYRGTQGNGPARFLRHIHPTWSGMDSLTTAIETAIVESGPEIQLLGDNDQATYFEVGCVLAGRGKLVIESIEEDLDSQLNSLEKYPAVLMATMNPSTPQSAGPTPAVINEVVCKRYARLRRPITLIIDATIQTDSTVDPIRQLDALFESKISMLVMQGKAQVILARSYQKYQSLGSGKFMGGCTTLIHSPKLTKSAQYLQNLDSSTFRELDEVQFFVHILKYAAGSELKMATRAAKNAEFVALLMPRLPDRSGKHISGVPFALKDSKNKTTLKYWIQRLGLAEMDSFGFVVSAYLEIPVGMRLNPGQEARERLIEKFFAAGHLWNEQKIGTWDVALPFQNIVFQINSVLQEVDAGYSGALDEEKHDPRMETLPFNPNDPGLNFVLPLPTQIAAYYRRRSRLNESTDLDHVLASYLSLTFRFRSTLTRWESTPRNPKAEEQYYAAIITLTDDERLYFAWLCSLLFDRGLLEVVTTDMRAELSAAWLRLLLEFDGSMSWQFVSPLVGVIANAKDEEKIDLCVMAQVRLYGQYISIVDRKKILAEAENSNGWFAKPVKDFIGKTTPLLEHNTNLSIAPTILTPSVEKIEAKRH